MHRRSVTGRVLSLIFSGIYELQNTMSTFLSVPLDYKKKKTFTISTTRHNSSNMGQDDRPAGLSELMGQSSQSPNQHARPFP
jgi:hypothetical protein